MYICISIAKHITMKIDLDATQSLSQDINIFLNLLFEIKVRPKLYVDIRFRSFLYF